MVAGLVARNLSERMQGMAITHKLEAEPALSILTGELADQAALAGVLDMLYDLQYTLLSAEQIPPGEADTTTGLGVELDRTP